jgi:hypothetical protein
LCVIRRARRSITHSPGERGANGTKKSLVKDEPIRFAWNDGGGVELAMTI